MKMSDMFDEYDLDGSERMSNRIYNGDLTASESFLVADAIVNYDALVEALNNIVNGLGDFYVTEFGVKGYCSLCDRLNKHDKDCKVNAAINLLDKINGESNE